MSKRTTSMWRVTSHDLLGLGVRVRFAILRAVVFVGFGSLPT
jgi:hypothetical protein